MSPKNSLGKGLGAMFPDLLEGFNDRPAFVICGIEELSPNRFQARRDFNDKDQQQLVSSVKKSGIIQPIIVRKTARGYEIIAGERRWRAAQKAGLQKVPVIIRKAQDLEVAELSLIENIQREALNPIEEAEAYQTLTGQFGLSQEDLSNRVGKDRSTIANSLRLLKLPGPVKNALIGKKITSGHARPLLGIDSPKEQLKILETILKNALSVRDTERLLQNLKKTGPEKKKMKKDPYVVDVERNLSKIMMTRVQIYLNQKKAGRIEILFNSAEDLDRLIKVLMDE
ncbi:MAG: ParB/RepB/Spo0J family partition protein [Deltaproteobacteria bacterium]|jgi:ParB family chromosome partitioning protein|nr:ParB/RepB/Spo0J family partition protein [Deltaproteobacteria bacterium]